MEEAITKTASQLVPLLVVLAVVFGVLVTLALVLRTRVRHEPRTGSKPSRQPRSVGELEAGDLLSVLGRIFAVRGIERMTFGDNPALWCALESDEDPGRMVLQVDLGRVVLFPGQGEVPQPGPFPERIERPECSYQSVAESVRLGENWRLRCYRGTSDRWVAVEERDGESTLWRGKQVPSEGVTRLEGDG